MSYKTSLCSLLILFLFINYSAQEQNSTDVNNTLSLASVTVATTTSLETSTSTVSSCPGGHINPPDCTKCATNSDNKDGKCLGKKSELKPSSGIGRRIFLIFVACLLTISLIVGMLFVYGRLNQQHRRRLSSNPGNTSDSSTSNTNIRNRFNNILRSIGLNNLNKRGRFNFFSISNNNNNNNSSRQNRQQESSRAPLSENPDEALLFDDPYADGGFNNSSSNPYKSLTLAVT